ncbi:MAG: alanine--tRNA ligase, partial [Eubacteriales bacterium]|nr:alanine--tRNA ligase [Eubacteriales bacterium]
GPCGPCSEIYYDRGPEYGCGKPDCKPGCDCDRYLEFWNHVFSQYSKQEDGTYANMEHPNIDTGMGLERMACIMQNTDSIFDIDTIRYILDAVVALTDKKYEAGDRQADISIRIVTDHLRSMTFMIADGILPSNEGRGYVLRRLIRRAARHGKLLGIKGSFLPDLIDKVIDVSGEAYPEIVEKQDYIKKIVAVEEDRFEATLEQGNAMISEYAEDMKKNGTTVLDGDKAFLLYDTYGFPIEMTEEILADYGYTADMDGFRRNMEKQKETARAGRKDVSEEAWKEEVMPKDIPNTAFTGYEELVSEADVLAIYQNSAPVESVSEGETATIYTDRTPFYAESGGQASDAGTIRNDAFEAELTGLLKRNNLIGHKIQVKKGSLKVGDKVTLSVAAVKRYRTARNHTATHLLQKALQEVLGSHVSQSGAYYDENGLRFDFTHFEAMTKDQIEDVERRVNDKIDEFLPVTTEEMPLEEAKKTGAMALFSEKYGDIVRVVRCGNWSTELCGGTHVSNTGEIGAFRILSESGVAAGVRRVEAVTGTGVLELEKQEADTLAEVSEILKANKDNLLLRAKELAEQNHSLKKQLTEAKKSKIGSGVDALIQNAEDVNGIQFISKKFEDTDMDTLRQMSDEIRRKIQNVVMTFASVNDQKVILLVSVSEDLTSKGIHAGKIIKAAAKYVRGGGGGKADMAQAGGSDPNGIEKAFDAVKSNL